MRNNTRGCTVLGPPFSVTDLGRLRVRHFTLAGYWRQKALVVHSTSSQGQLFFKPRSRSGHRLSRPCRSGACLECLTSRCGAHEPQTGVAWTSTVRTATQFGRFWSNSGVCTLSHLAASHFKGAVSRRRGQHQGGAWWGSWEGEGSQHAGSGASSVTICKKASAVAGFQEGIGWLRGLVAAGGGLAVVAVVNEIKNSHRPASPAQPQPQSLSTPTQPAQPASVCIVLVRVDKYVYFFTARNDDS